MLGCLELAGGSNYTAKHIPGVQNTLADGISRWPRVILADKVRELTHFIEWYEQPIGQRGSGFIDVVLQTESIHIKHDDILRNLVTNDGEKFGRLACLIRCHATPRDAVGMPWYAMGDTMAMARKNQ